KLDTAFIGGLAWTTGAKLLTQFFSWGSLFILARLLSTSDFGIMDMAGIFVQLTNVLADFGVSTAVLQMHELDRNKIRQLNTASVAICALGYVFVVLASPIAVAFFRVPALKPLILVNGLGLMLTGFQGVPMGLLQKDLDYKRLSVAEEVQGFL